jgi:hypothetical protein
MIGGCGVCGAGGSGSIDVWRRIGMAGPARARGIVWIGVPTDRYAEGVRFFRDVLGCRVRFGR